MDSFVSNTDRQCLGSLQGFKAGKYLLRYTDNNFGVQTEDVEDAYLAYVNSPTPYGTSIVKRRNKGGSN